ITLQDLLNPAGDGIVFLADILRVEDTAVRRQRIDGRINALFRNTPLQVDKSVQVLEGVGRSGVGRIVGGNIDGLYAGDGAAGRAGDAFLKLAHLRRQGR